MDVSSKFPVAKCKEKPGGIAAAGFNRLSI
jgi:hypothetical protein